MPQWLVQPRLCTGNCWNRCSAGYGSQNGSENRRRRPQKTRIELGAENSCGVFGLKKVSKERRVPGNWYRMIWWQWKRKSDILYWVVAVPFVVRPALPWKRCKRSQDCKKCSYQNGLQKMLPDQYQKYIDWDQTRAEQGTSPNSTSHPVVPKLFGPKRSLILLDTPGKQDQGPSAFRVHCFSRKKHFYDHVDFSMTW